MIFETHAHYDDEAFDEDREALVSSLPGKGIERVMNIGASLSSCKTTLELMDKYPTEEALTAYNSGKPGKSDYADTVLKYWRELR